MDQSPNHLIMMMVSCISTSDCGELEMSFKRGATIDRNGNISIKLHGFVCTYKNCEDVLQFDATQRSTMFLIVE